MGDLNNKNQNEALSSLEMEQNEEEFKKYKNTSIAAYVTKDQPRVASIEVTKQNLLKEHKKSDLHLMREYSFGSYKEPLVVPKEQVQKCVSLDEDISPIIYVQNQLEHDGNTMEINIKNLAETMSAALTSYNSKKIDIDNKLNRLDTIPELIEQKNNEIDKIKASTFKRFLSYFTGEIGALENEQRSLKEELKEIKEKLPADLASFHMKSDDLSATFTNNQSVINKITKYYSKWNKNEKFIKVNQDFIDLGNKVSVSLFPYVAPLLGKIASSIHDTEKRAFETQQKFEKIKNHHPQALNAVLHEYQNKVNEVLTLKNASKINDAREFSTVKKEAMQQRQPVKQQELPMPKHDSRSL
ncbi:hypothetical protein ACIJDO_001643 [Enterococcus hirae]